MTTDGKSVLNADMFHLSWWCRKQSRDPRLKPAETRLSEYPHGLMPRELSVVLTRSRGLGLAWGRDGSSQGGAISKQDNPSPCWFFKSQFLSTGLLVTQSPPFHGDRDTH